MANKQMYQKATPLLDNTCQSRHTLTSNRLMNKRSLPGNRPRPPLEMHNE